MVFSAHLFAFQLERKNEQIFHHNNDRVYRWQIHKGHRCRLFTFFVGAERVNPHKNLLSAASVSLLRKKEKLMNYWFFEVFRSRFWLFFSCFRLLFSLLSSKKSHERSWIPYPIRATKAMPALCWHTKEMCIGYLTTQQQQLCVGIIFSALILAWISLNVIDGSWSFVAS